MATWRKSVIVAFGIVLHQQETVTSHTPRWVR
jgi:hypothetical protein